VSFILELDAPDVDQATAARLAHVTQEPGYLPVLAPRRRRWSRRAATGLSLRDERDEVPVLSDAADWSEQAFTLDERGRELLAATISLLATELQPGWALRAYWVGDACEEEQIVTGEELIDLVRRSALDRTTRYRVA
jgi:hypothetical protein